MTEMLFVFGTRPEALKISPVVQRLGQRGINPRVLCTGQHWDLLRGTPAESVLADSEKLDFDCSKLDLVRCNAKLTYQIKKHLEDSGIPDILVVQGDTTSAACGAVGSRLCHGKQPVLVHLEAGVRSHVRDDPWPEEANRMEITRLADWHLAPTNTTIANLLNEGVERDRIVLTGNTIISALADAKVVTQPATNTILITLHRREVQNDKMATQLAMAIYHEAAKWPELNFVWPVHPGFGRFVDLQSQANISVLKPLAYKTFQDILVKSEFVLTDSGGVVEEAATLGVPAAILRNVNDRVEAEYAGIAKLFPLVPNCVAEAVSWGCQTERKAVDCFGTAGAADKVCEFLEGLA